MIVKLSKCNFFFGSLSKPSFTSSVYRISQVCVVEVISFILYFDKLKATIFIKEWIKFMASMRLFK